jgi:hypothetical protein
MMSTLFAIALAVSACLTVVPEPQPVAPETPHEGVRYLHKSYPADAPACAASAQAALRSLGFPILSTNDTSVTSRRADGTPIRIEWVSAGPGWTHVNFMVGDLSHSSNHWTAIQIKAMFEQILYRGAWKQP